MSTETTTEQKFLYIEDWCEPPMPPTDLIFDNGEPMESNRQRIEMNVLIRLVNQAFAPAKKSSRGAICLFTTATLRRGTGIFEVPISLWF